MTDGQLAHWRNLAVACDMPPLYVDRNTLEAVRAAFPHLFAALLCERERSARSETALASMLAALLATQQAVQP